MITAAELMIKYQKMGFQDFSPTNETWAQKFLDSHKSLAKLDIHDNYTVIMFKDWVEDNNAFDTGDFIH